MPVLILGPTNDFPEGKMSEADEGGLRMAVGIEDNRIILAFGKPVAWIGMDPAGARALAALLRSRAEEIQPEPKEPL